MANYQSRFDGAAPEARRLVVNRGGEIRNIIPRFYGSDFDRLIKSISSLLERVDKGNYDHPEYLAHSSGNVAEYAVQVILSVPSSMESGAPHFVNNTLPLLLACEERLVKAVGNYYYKVKEIKDRQIKEIQKLAEESLEFYSETSSIKDSVANDRDNSKEYLAQMQDMLSSSQDISAKIEETRELVVKLASGDGRGKSLEALKRQAEEKLASIETILSKSNAASSAADAASKKLDGSSQIFEKALAELAEITSRANLVLGLSSQAGLANSYIQESRKLEVRSHIFTSILYATATLTALIAAFYVIPSLEHSIETAGSSARALPITFLRATILAPLVYVIYFTNRQIASLETL